MDFPILTLAGVIIVITLAIAAILMPIFVILISDRLGKVTKTLAAMEHMMRHGK